MGNYKKFKDNDIFMYIEKKKNKCIKDSKL